MKAFYTLTTIFIITSILLDSAIERMNKTSFVADVEETVEYTAELNDTIPNKTIKVYFDADSDPIKYSRDILTGVCIDGECRLVSIQLFWNATGRYLGFVLPDGEFLSKTEHDPFTDYEYDRLHDILSEDNSPLGNYTIEELVPEKDSTSSEIDAMSSATIEAILDHIVEGAVYTTHTLWHIVYGSTKTEVEKQSIGRLNSAFVLKILNSEYMRDQVWVLNKLNSSVVITEDLRNKLMELISGTDVYLAERALNALKPGSMTKEVQSELVGIFATSGFLQKRLILQKYKESETLSPEIIPVLTAALPELNGTLAKSLLELYQLHSVHDGETVAVVRDLLKEDNKHIAKQALSYLENLDNPDKKTLKSIQKYKKSHSKT